MTGANCPEPRFSIVVPAFNCARTVLSQLQSLAAQVEAEAGEVIVADNGSTDETASVAEQYLLSAGLGRVVDASSKQGAAHARNIGASTATGELLLFCDADDITGPEWVSSHVTALRDFEVVVGVISNFRGEPPDFAAVDWPGTVPHFGSYPLVTGSNFSCRRRVWEQVGGMDERFLRGQDAEFGVRVADDGRAIGVEAEARVLRRVPPRASGRFRKAVGYGRAHRSIAAVHPEFPPLRHREELAWLAPRLPFIALSDVRRNTWVRRCGSYVGWMRGPFPGIRR